jgi:hypothetical protein
LSNLNAAAFAFTNKSANHDHSVTSVNELILLSVHSIPYVVRVGQPLSKAVYPDVRLGIEHISSGIEHDLGVRELDRSLSLAAIQRFKDALRDLHVLLRHRPRSIPQAQESA